MLGLIPRVIAGIFLILASLSLNAQQRDCGTMDILQQNLLEDPSRQESMDLIEAFTQKTDQNPMKAVNGTITIPVVVHVIYGNSTENISDAQVLSQIQVLNDDFRRTNSDANNTWSQAADTDIEFCMATVDPNGNPTNGITRTSTSTSAFGTNDQMKYSSSGGKDAWPRDEYLNMWVCDISGSILGYAQFPGSGAAATDGVVMDYQYFGTIGTASAPFDLGRTATHEVGHWLNLRHIWGDGGCNVDDFVSDTPTSDAANYGCASGHSSCSSTDMVQNYMDYSDDACMNLFTDGQRTRMRALFEPGGFRESLLSSGGCGNSGPVATCTDGIQNQGETGIDCGGPCAPCPCAGTNVSWSITFDNYPEETSWSIVNASGATVASGGTYASQADGSTLSGSVCLADGCYDFIINDAYGDGICCSYGNGSYSVSDASGTLVSGASFTSSETTNFCVGSTGPTPTCNDGIQNQGEAGVDCGGPCTACASCNDGIQNQGESGVDCGGPCSACPTCNDGIQNQGESGVDCGGPCTACASCNDGIQNQGESGVDCGGPCTACASCSDGVQNQGETGVDCGGPCAPCNTGCNGTEVTVTITFDNYPEETSWTISNDAGVTVLSGGTYGNQADGSTYSSTNCLPNDCYTFTINDAYGDGICCSYGNGSFSVSDASGTLVSGSSFASSASGDFCFGSTPPPAETCSDGIQNQGETGVDCGGPCAPCNTGGCSYVVIDDEGFESNWGIWNDGGSDAARSASWTAYSVGNASIRLRDNTSTSVMTTDALNLSSYDELTVDFTFFPRSMENGEDFWLQVSTNGGSSYTTVAVYAAGSSFNNNSFYTDNVVIDGPFSSNTKLRFRCDASGNADYVYIDEVEISGCVNSSRDGGTEVAAEKTELTNIETLGQDPLSNVRLYPNPASTFLNLSFDAATETNAEIFITDISGRTVKQQTISVAAMQQQHRLDISDLPNDMYLIHIVCGDQVKSEKIMVIR